jgi:hypothetical protein
LSTKRNYKNYKRKHTWNLLASNCCVCHYLMASMTNSKCGEPDWRPIGVFRFLAALKAGGEHTMAATDATTINKMTVGGKAEQAVAKKRNTIAMGEFDHVFHHHGWHNGTGI